MKLISSLRLQFMFVKLHDASFIVALTIYVC